MNIEFLLLLVFFSSLILTYGIKQWAIKKQLLDIPNKRSSHQIPTPRGGGLGIVIIFYLLLSYWYWQYIIQQDVFMGLLGLVIIAIVGYIDDHGHVAAKYRLFIHFVVAAWVCYWLGGLSWADYYPWLKIPVLFISLFYIVWLLNLYNFMDGIDGIASVEFICVIAGVAMILWLNHNSGNVFTSDLLNHSIISIEFLLSLLLIVLGFLIWNWPPARIFMGDVGSAFLGILLASLSLISHNEGILNVFIWLILLAVFISDATYTLLIRLLRRKNITQAHCSHTYQILSRRFGHLKVTIGVGLINVFWLWPLAWWADAQPQWLILMIVLAYLPLIVLAIRTNAGYQQE